MDFLALALAYLLLPLKKLYSPRLTCFFFPEYTLVHRPGIRFICFAGPRQQDSGTVEWRPANSTVALSPVSYKENGQLALVGAESEPQALRCESMKTQRSIQSMAGVALNGLYRFPMLHRRSCYSRRSCCRISSQLNLMQSLRTSCFHSVAITKTLHAREIRSPCPIQAPYHKRRASSTKSSIGDTVTISRPAEDEDLDEAHIGIADVEDVASYNWLDRPSPAIMVPGIPSVWHVPAVPPRLKPDTGKRIRYIDQNADRNPWSPLEPLVRAVTTTHPDFDFDSLDIVTDRRPIRHLLEFVSGKSQDFQFGVEVVRKIAFFTRIEKQTRETIRSGMFQGYRRPFQQWYTKIPLFAQESTSHHRMIRYQLGALKLLVRSTFDAYLLEELPNHNNSEGKDIEDQADLVNFMSSVSRVPKASSIKDTPEAPVLTVVPGGKEIGHSALFELSTRSKSGKTPINIQAKFPGLWLSQTPHYVIALHENVKTRQSRLGKELPPLAEFRDIQIRHIKENLQRWEKDNQKSIKKFVVVLQQILKEAMASDAPCIVRYSGAEGCLAISKVDPGRFRGLSEDMQGKLSTKN